MATKRRSEKDEVKGKRLPSIDPAAFTPGDEITIGRTRYVVQQNQHGESRVMVTNPKFEPGGDAPRFVYLTYQEIRAQG